MSAEENSATALTIEIVSDLEQGGLTARLPDIPAYGEGEIEEEAIDDSKKVVRDYIETFGLDSIQIMKHE